MDDTKTDRGPPAFEKYDGRRDSMPRAHRAVSAGAGESGGRVQGPSIGDAIGGAGGGIAGITTAGNETGFRGLSGRRRRSLSFQTGARGKNVQRGFALALRLPRSSDPDALESHWEATDPTDCRSGGRDRPAGGTEKQRLGTRGRGVNGDHDAWNEDSSRRDGCLRTVSTRRRRGMVMAVALGLSGATSVRADLSFKPMGQPHDIGSSWFQRFYLDSTMSYDQLGMVITPMVEGGGVWGGVGAAVGLQSGPGTFATHGAGPGAASNASDASAAGGRLDAMRQQRSVSFAIAVRTPQDFHLTLFTYDDAMSPYSVRTMSAVWGDSRWTFDSPPVITWEQYEEMIRPEQLPPAAPAPSASLLGMMGLALVAKWRRRVGRHSSRRCGEAA